MPSSQTEPAHQRALVLGGGGSVGMAYHTGVLRSLARHGISPDRTDLVVGTSAGAAVAAFVRTGGTLEALTGFLHDAQDRAERDGGLFGLQPAWQSPLDLGRRLAGVASVGAAVALRGRGGTAQVARACGAGGLFRSGYLREAIVAQLPDRWPERALWLSAVDLASRRPLLLGREGPHIPLPVAVVASCSVPGVYDAVQVGGTTLVDGGVVSLTHVQAVARAGVPDILVVAPVAGRSRFDRTLDEVEAARRIGATVTLVTPSDAERARHGSNLFRADRAVEVADRAEAATDEFLSDSVLAGWTA